MLLLKIILILITLAVLVVSIKDAYVYRIEKDIITVLIIILYLVYIIFN